MQHIQSTSGIRGIIGNQTANGLTPPAIIALATALGTWMVQQNTNPTLVLGRDARPSSPMVSALVSATLQSMGIHVLDLGLSTTPTVAWAVCHHQASGGVVISASHNPSGWNALKLLNADGEMLEAEATAQLLALVDQPAPVFVPTARLGQLTHQKDVLDGHIAQILALPLVDKAAIQQRRFRIAVDGINSTGGLAVPRLLQALGVTNVTQVHCTPHGLFAHDPEPLPAHLTDLTRVVPAGRHDLGVAVDPDVDRLAILDEDGRAWGEDYTLVAVSDYVLRHTPGNTVSNLSSSQTLTKLTAQYSG